jgi:hypothetical protein
MSEQPERQPEELPALLGELTFTASAEVTKAADIAAGEGSDG